MLSFRLVMCSAAKLSDFLWSHELDFIELLEPIHVSLTKIVNFSDFIPSNFFFLHQYFPFVSGTLMTYMLSLLIVFHRSFSSAQVFFSLSFTLSNVCWSILKFTDSLLCHLHSAAGSIAWMFHFRYYPFRASLVAHLVKNPPAMRETWLQSLGWEDPLEKGKAIYSSILAWRIPWTVWPYGRRVGHDWATFIFTFCCTFQF